MVCASLQVRGPLNPSPYTKDFAPHDATVRLGAYTTAQKYADVSCPSCLLQSEAVSSAHELPLKITSASGSHFRIQILAGGYISETASLCQQDLQDPSDSGKTDLWHGAPASIRERDPSRAAPKAWPCRVRGLCGEDFQLGEEEEPGPGSNPKSSGC